MSAPIGIPINVSIVNGQAKAINHNLQANNPIADYLPIISGNPNNFPKPNTNVETIQVPTNTLEIMNNPINNTLNSDQSNERPEVQQLPPEIYNKDPARVSAPAGNPNITGPHDLPDKPAGPGINSVFGLGLNEQQNILEKPQVQTGFGNYLLGALGLGVIGTLLLKK